MRFAVLARIVVAAVPVALVATANLELRQLHFCTNTLNGTSSLCAQGVDSCQGEGGCTCKTLGNATLGIGDNSTHAPVPVGVSAPEEVEVVRSNHPYLNAP